MANDAQKLVFAYLSLAFGTGAKRLYKDERMYKKKWLENAISRPTGGSPNILCRMIRDFVL